MASQLAELAERLMEPPIQEQHTYGLGPAGDKMLPADINPRKRRDPVIPEKPEGRLMTICSVFPRPAFNKVYNFGHYEIEACPPCDNHGAAPCPKCNNYAVLKVDAAKEAIEDPFGTDGSGRRLNWIPATAIARSLLNESCVDRGVFVCNGDEPTEDELRQARATYKKWAEGTVSQADGVWSGSRKISEIDPLARDAAKFLGVKREWLSETQDKVECEACGELSRKGAVLCKCGYPYNWQKAYEMGLLNDKQEKYGRANGMVSDPVQTPDLYKPWPEPTTTDTYEDEAFVPADGVHESVNTAEPMNTPKRRGRPPKVHSS